VSAACLRSHGISPRGSRCLQHASRTHGGNGDLREGPSDGGRRAISEPACLPARRAQPRALRLHQQRRCRTAVLDAENLGGAGTLLGCLAGRGSRLDFDRDRWQKHPLSDRGRGRPKIGGTRGAAPRSRRAQAYSGVGPKICGPASRHPLLARPSATARQCAGRRR